MRRAILREVRTFHGNFIGEGTDPCSDATNVAAAKNLAVTGTTDGSGSARVKGWTTANVSIVALPL